MWVNAEVEAAAEGCDGLAPVALFAKPAALPDARELRAVRSETLSCHALLLRLAGQGKAKRQTGGVPFA